MDCRMSIVAGSEIVQNNGIHSMLQELPAIAQATDNKRMAKAAVTQMRRTPTTPRRGYLARL